jgi:hypothetical protein
VFSTVTMTKVMDSSLARSAVSLAMVDTAATDEVKSADNLTGGAVGSSQYRSLAFPFPAYINCAQLQKSTGT